MNKLTIRFLCSNLIKDESLATALTFWLVFLHSPSLYVFFKGKLIINFNPEKLFIARTWKLLIKNTHVMTFLLLRRRWNLSGFNFIQLFRNGKVRISTTLLISLITFNYYPLQMECYHLHDLLSRHFGLNRKRSWRNTEKTSGPNMEPCGTPCSIFVQLLNVLYTFIFSLR